MTPLTVADLVVIASRALGTGTDAALDRIDVAAARAALAAAEDAAAGPHPGPAAAGGGRLPGAAAAAAAAGLVHALLRHPPFPERAEQLAIAAGLQFLAVNGWQADLDPPAAAAVVVENLASGRLTPADAAAWLTPRLARAARPRGRKAHVPAPRRGLIRLPALPSASELARLLAGRRRGEAGMVVRGRMLARFTDGAAAAIGAAQEEARRLGHDHIDPEHLLLALIRQPEGVAARVLDRLGVSPETLRQQIEAATGRGRGTQSGPIRPSRPRGLKVINAALPEALVQSHVDRRGRPLMGTGDLLLAQFHDDGPAAQALVRLGAGEREVRAAVTALLAETNLTASGR
jgi:Clp amino terminal domain, pathogenicity island component